jgi:hypothetical protein
VDQRIAKKEDLNYGNKEESACKESTCKESPGQEACGKAGSEESAS